MNDDKFAREAPPRKAPRGKAGNVETVTIFRRMPVGYLQVSEDGDVPFEVGALREMADIVAGQYDGPNGGPGLVHDGIVHDVLIVEHKGRKVSVLLNDGHPDA